MAKQPAPRSASSVKPPNSTPGPAELASNTASASLGRISDHHSFASGEAQLLQRDTHDARVRLPVFDIVAAGCCSDKLIDLQKRQVVLQLRSFAVGREGEHAASTGVSTPSFSQNWQVEGGNNGHLDRWDVEGFSAYSPWRR